MSKALELAAWMNEGAWHQITLGQVWEIGAELRRLDQVEAEHAALLKAISDAEPVLWMDADTKVLYEHDTTEVDRFHGFKPTVPLYTLNGIKKP